MPELTIVIETDDQSVAANSRSEFLSGLDDALRGINFDLHSDIQLRPRVAGFEPGSIVIPVELVDVGATVLSVLTQQYAIDVAKAFIDQFVVRQIFRANHDVKIISGDGGISLIVAEGATVNIDNRSYNTYAENKPADAAISKCFKALEMDEGIDALTIIDRDNHEMFSAKRPEFAKLSETNTSIAEETKVEVVRASLYVIRVVFEEHRKWEFKYKGNKISAYISDKDFIKELDMGESFSKDDLLIVDLQIGSIYDSTTGFFKGQTYDIVKVYEHIPHAQQGKMTDND